tara:strand:+ start:6661 stop:7281 length:621 start_codon:yes stop_codon:yes gene_type:complete
MKEKKTLKQFDAYTNVDKEMYKSMDNFLGAKRPSVENDPFIQQKAFMNSLFNDFIDGREYTANFEAPGGRPIEEWYEDSEGNQTIGLGHKRRDDIDYNNWDSQSSMDQFHQDYNTAQNYAKNMLKEVWSGIPNNYQNIVTDMVFNMGGANVNKNFQGFLASLYNQDYERAAQELEWVDPDDKSKGKSKYYTQTGTRARKHQEILRR